MRDNTFVYGSWMLCAFFKGGWRALILYLYHKNRIRKKLFAKKVFICILISHLFVYIYFFFYLFNLFVLGPSFLF